MTEPTNGHRALIEALRDDAGDYAVHMRGAPMSHELSWDARDVRAWRAADALEAAAGVAPQAPSDWDCACKCGHLYHSECSETCAPVQPSGKVQDSPEIENLGGEISIPVQPSSTVDEGKLAEVLHLANHEGCQSVIPTQAERHAAKAITDHLRGAGL